MAIGWHGAAAGVIRLYWLGGFYFTQEFLMEYLTEFGYIGLFAAAFLAATILPLGSEVVLVALLLSGLSPAGLVAVATVGNVLGSLTNYYLGFWASSARVRRWLALSDRAYVQATERFKRYGLVSLCFAWLPVIGDPLTVVAGVMRIRLLWFVPLVTLGKCLRYIALSYVVL